MMERPIYYDYLIFDEDGYWIGIKDDAPEEAKKEWEEHQKIAEQGIKL